MSYATVSGNLQSINAGSCPEDDYAAEVSAGYAGHGTFSPTPVDVDFDGCV